MKKTVAKSSRFTVAHVVPRMRTVHVSTYRTYRHRTLAAALKKAGQMHRAGYLVWVERTGQAATR